MIADNPNGQPERPIAWRVVLVWLVALVVVVGVSRACSPRTTRPATENGGAR